MPPSGRLTPGVIRLLLGTFASKALGFVRLVVMARFFGGRAAMDMFNIAFMIPNLFRRVLGEQTVESAFLPTFRSLLTEGKVREAWRTASVVLNWLLVLLVAAAGLCAVLSPQLVSWVVAPGFDASASAGAAALGRVMCPFMVLIGLAAFAGSLLLAHGQQWAYGLAPTLFNVGWIVTMVLGHERLGVVSLALGVVIGGALQFLAASFAVLRGPRAGRCDPRAGLRDEHAARVLRLAGPVCVAALIARCASVVDRAVASFLPEGSVAALGYAMPLVLLPFALFALSVGRAALVPMTERAALGDGEGFRRLLQKAVGLGLLLLVPTAVGVFVFAEPFAGILQRGRFGPGEVRMAAVALQWYAVGLPSMGLVSILSRALHARKKTRAPMAAAAIALGVNAALSIGLAQTPMRHGGIALATSIAMTLQAGLLWAALRRELRGQSADGRVP